MKGEFKGGDRVRHKETSLVRYVDRVWIKKGTYVVRLGAPIEGFVLWDADEFTLLPPTKRAATPPAPGGVK